MKIDLWRDHMDETGAEEDKEDGQGDPGQELEANAWGQVCYQP